MGEKFEKKERKELTFKERLEELAPYFVNPNKYEQNPVGFQDEELDKKLQNIKLEDLKMVVKYTISNLNFLEGKPERKGKLNFHPNAIFYMGEYDKDPNIPEEIKEEAKKLVEEWHKRDSSTDISRFNKELAEKTVGVAEKYIDYKLKTIEATVKEKGLSLENALSSIKFEAPESEHV